MANRGNVICLEVRIEEGGASILNLDHGEHTNGPESVLMGNFLVAPASRETFVALDTLIECFVACKGSSLEFNQFWRIEIVVGANEVRLTSVTLVADCLSSWNLLVHFSSELQTKDRDVIVLARLGWTVTPNQFWLMHEQAKFVVDSWFPSKLVARILCREWTWLFNRTMDTIYGHHKREAIVMIRKAAKHLQQRNILLAPSIVLCTIYRSVNLRPSTAFEL